MALTLSKKVPSRIRTAKARWCRKDWMEMSDKVRAIRGPRDKMRLCYWCKHEFSNGEMMSIACFEGRVGNRTLCGMCADELLSSEAS